jgi:hypothetical protein
MNGSITSTKHIKNAHRNEENKKETVVDKDLNLLHILQYILSNYYVMGLFLEGNKKMP